MTLLAFDNAVLDFFSQSITEAAQVATGLAVGNLTKCPQTLGFSSSEIIKNSRAILTVLAKDAATDAAAEQAFRQACRMLNTENSRMPRGRLLLTIRGMREYLSRSCRDFIE